MKKYEVHCKYRNAGDQGILYLGRYVTVEALDEREARMKAIEVVHNSGRFEHVTPDTCKIIGGDDSEENFQQAKPAYRSGER